MSAPLFPIYVEFSGDSKQMRAGFINQSGTIVIEPIFDCAGMWREGCAPIQIEERWGFVESTGNLSVIPFSGGKAEFYGGRAIFTDPSTALCGAINYLGEVVIEPRYFRIGRFNGGVAWMSNTGAWNSMPGSYGILDANGSVKAPFRFDDMRNFHEGLAAAEVAGKWGFVTAQGDFAIPAQFDAATRFSEGLARVKAGELWGFINKDAHYIVEPKYSSAQDFSEGLAPVRRGSQWGFINREGVDVIPCSWSRTSAFSCGLARVQVDGKVGYIDQKGVLVIRNQFEMAQDFMYGLSLVETATEIGYIDVTGNFVWRVPYLDISFAYI